MPHPIRRMRQIFEDHKGDSDIDFSERCTYHKPDNYHFISANKLDIGTLNMFLFYIIFRTNDLP